MSRTVYLVTFSSKESIQKIEVQFEVQLDFYLKKYPLNIHPANNKGPLLFTSFEEAKKCLVKHYEKKANHYGKLVSKYAALTRNARKMEDEENNS